MFLDRSFIFMRHYTPVASNLMCTSLLDWRSMKISSGTVMNVSICLYLKP